VLRDYVFEEDTEVECEFQVSWNWIAGPNLRAESGNLDSGGPVVHSININGRKNEIGQIETAILAIAYEFWQANTNNTPSESTKCFVKFDPEDYMNLWGTDLTKRVRKSLVEYHKLDLSVDISDQRDSGTSP